MTGLLVRSAGVSLLLQDLGRRGQAHLGVPPAGALDPAALSLANRLVGNAPSAAGLEVVLGGAVFEALRSLRIACTGARMPLRVGGRERAWAEPVSVQQGEVVELGTAHAGLRAWLAVSGGIAVAPVLGSRASDTLTGLGPAPVRAGDVLGVGTAAKARPIEVAPGGEWSPVGDRRLRLMIGPRDDWFGQSAVEQLLTTTYRVLPASNRIAIRLEAAGGQRLERAVDEELPSEGVVTGAVQVPGDGQPLVFLADHPVTGGYPVIGVVEPSSLADCAQLRPGDAVGFVLV